MNRRDYLMNVLNLTKFGTEYAYKKLREPVNKTDWISHGRPAIVNAFYAPLENSIRKQINLPITSPSYFTLYFYKSIK